MSGLKGLGTSAGIAKGKVRLVLTPADFNSFQQGEILVNKMTNPSMTQIMAKAAAIVCDIGGLTSHASVLAREMGVPCVVNTKNATKVLKNGQEVTVNGASGEISFGKEIIGSREKIIQIQRENNFSKQTENREWLDLFVDQFLQTTADMDFQTLLPFNCFELEQLYVEELLTNLNRAIENPKTLENIAKMSGKVSPGMLSDQMYETAVDLKMAKWSKEKRLKVIQFFHDVLTQLHAGDPYISDGNNLVQSEKEISESLAKIKFEIGNEKIAKELGVLYTALYHLSNGLYSDMYMGICVQNYGAYDVSRKFGEGYELVVKNAFNLKPIDVWPEAVEIPFNEVKIYCVYNGVKFKTDMFSCHSFYEGNANTGLKHWAVEADGKQLTFQQVCEISATFSLLSDKYWKKITSLPFEELKQKGVLIKQFALKPLFDAAGIDWKPTKEMKNAVKNKSFGLPPALKVPTNNKEYWRKIIDPRLDFNF